MSKRKATDQPNFVLINCDDLGYGDLGCYGSTCNATPALDRLAAEGTRFTDFYMASPVCSPSRGGMMTGCYPRRVGFGAFEGRWVLFPGQGVGLNPDEVTVAALLQKRGYATKLVGKWHCGDQPPFLPTRHGFDEYYGIPFSNDMGRQVGREHQYPPLPLMAGEEVIEQQPDQAALTERYVEESVRFIRRNKDNPFFLYLAHMYVHLPIFAPERFMSQSRNGRYGAGVECVDWSTGVIVHELHRLGIAGNTLVMFTSDNGSRARNEGGSNAPLRGTKGTTWDGGQRVPFITWWPGVVPSGRTSGEIVGSIDLLPTMARLAGTASPDDRIIDGLDFAALLTGASGTKGPRDTFAYYFRDSLAAVRSGPWKLHVSRQEAGVHELYNLAEDIGETRDVIAEHPEIVRALEAEIDRLREDLGDQMVGAAGHCRPIGRVDNPVALTAYDPNYPYYMAEYDQSKAG